MSIPISQFIPPPPPPLTPRGVHTFVLYICVSISAQSYFLTATKTKHDQGLALTLKGSQNLQDWFSRNRERTCVCVHKRVHKCHPCP